MTLWKIEEERDLKQRDGSDGEGDGGGLLNCYPDLYCSSSSPPFPMASP